MLDLVETLCQTYELTQPYKQDNRCMRFAVERFLLVACAIIFLLQTLD